MVFETEIIHEKQKAIVIAKKNYSFLSGLKTRLQNSSVEYFFSSRSPSTFKIFDYGFFINELPHLDKVKKHPEKRFICILLGQKGKNIHSYRDSNIKMVAVDGMHLDDYDLDKILWFAFSKTGENLLKLTSRSAVNAAFERSIVVNFDLKRFMTRKFFFLSVIVLTLIYHLLFIPPFLASAASTWISYGRLKKEDIPAAQNSLQTANFYLNLTKRLYSLPRPTFHLLGVALYPDNMIDLLSRGQTVMTEVISITESEKRLASLLFIKNKTPAEKSEVGLRLTLANRSLDVISENLAVMAENLPDNFSLPEMSDLLMKSEKILDYFQKIITEPTQKKYLIFFANNRELRPGGGFLGSFGILTLGDYTVNGIQVYDVYDADGQLTSRIDPPRPIAEFLNQPYWFLRDSNFSPDFLENYEKALFFLEQEMNLKDFDGSILVTTTAIENILSSFGDLYLPDYNERVNYKNFYLKTQSHVENDFFPGSTQKGNFLSSLMNQIFINLDRASIKNLGLMIKKSLDEKQLVAYVKDDKVQAFLDSSFWSGRVINPTCNIEENCIIDFVFPYDANLGANKANYFVNKNLYLKTSIDTSGKINHVLSIQYKNSSPSLVFPTGLYRNYFQVLLPKDSTVNQVTRNGVLVEKIDQADGIYKRVGFFFEVAPQETVEIKLSYSLGRMVEKQREIYQFVIQKQIGAMNSDFVLEFKPANNIQIVNQNFSPVVKDREIIYNTSLSTDKIFLIELVKQ